MRSAHPPLTPGRVTNDKHMRRADAPQHPALIEAQKSHKSATNVSVFVQLNQMEVQVAVRSLVLGDCYHYQKALCSGWAACVVPPVVFFFFLSVFVCLRISRLLKTTSVIITVDMILFFFVDFHILRNQCILFECNHFLTEVL